MYICACNTTMLFHVVIIMFMFCMYNYAYLRYKFLYIYLEIHKVLNKISEEKECENLAEWIKPCGNHLMWSATPTPSGDGELIWAKFESFLSHVVNKHEDLPNGNFNKCAHGGCTLSRNVPSPSTKQSSLSSMSLIFQIHQFMKSCVKF